MRISELRAREKFDAILGETIRQGMALYPERVDQNSTESWFEHPFFSIYVTRGFCSEGRRYLKEQYRYAPKSSLRLIQAPAVELLGTAALFERMLRPAFETFRFGNASQMMWMPGNHRFRLFDFERRNICVFPKAGFSTDGIEREIKFRTKYAERFDWVIPVLNAGQTSFVEPLLDTHPFNREFSERRRSLAIEQAAAALKELHKIKSGRLGTSSYLRHKHDQFEEAKVRVKSQFPGFCATRVDQVWEQATAVVTRFSDVDVSLTHGDFQPGNVLIPTGNDGRIWIIDWEDASVRARCYDAMTWMLCSRFPKDLAGRIRRFSGGDDSIWGEEMPRELAIALWTVEELIWHLETTTRPGIERLSTGLGMFLRELDKVWPSK